MLQTAIQCLEGTGPSIKRVLELGCGSGVISAFLEAHNYFDAIEELCISDISDEAVAKARSNVGRNISEHKNLKFEAKTGDGLTPWGDKKFDLIINDISAISDKVAPLSNWFDFAPCDAGEDGLTNTLKIMDDFSEKMNPGSVLIFPLLSLSNVTKFHSLASEKKYQLEKVASQKWPLPPEMYSVHETELNDLSERGIIQLTMKFGQLIAETSVYKMIL